MLRNIIILYYYNTWNYQLFLNAIPYSCNSIIICLITQVWNSTKIYLQLFREGIVNSSWKKSKLLLLLFIVEWWKNMHLRSLCHWIGDVDIEIRRNNEWELIPFWGLALSSSSSFNLVYCYDLDNPYCSFILKGFEYRPFYACNSSKIIDLIYIIFRKY